jgi:hypothetical protein
MAVTAEDRLLSSSLTVTRDTHSRATDTNPRYEIQ